MMEIGDFFPQLLKELFNVVEVWKKQSNNYEDVIRFSIS